MSENDILAILMILFGIVFGLEVLYISIVLFRNDLHKDDNLIHIMILTVYNIPTSVSVPTLSGMTLLYTPFIKSRPLLQLSIMTAQKLMLVGLIEVMTLTYCWSTLYIYYPLRSIVWKTNHYPLRSHVVVMSLTTLLIVGRAVYAYLFTTYEASTMQYVIVPHRIDGFIFLYGFVDPVLLGFMLCYLLIYRIARKHILSEHLKEQQQRTDRQKANLYKLNRKMIIVATILSFVWISYIAALHVNMYSTKYTSDAMLNSYFAVAILIDTLSFPFIIGYNVKVRKLLSRSVRKDYRIFLTRLSFIFCRCRRTNDENNRTMSF